MWTAIRGETNYINAAVWLQLPIEKNLEYNWLKMKNNLKLNGKTQHIFKMLQFQLSRVSCMPKFGNLFWIRSAESRTWRRKFSSGAAEFCAFSPLIYLFDFYRDYIPSARSAICPIFCTYCQKVRTSFTQGLCACADHLHQVQIPQ